MRVFALTGGIGCGKSTAAAVLKKLGAGIVDADAVSRELTAPGGAALPAIRAAFGDGVFFPDGTLDRRALAARVFGDPAALETLNRIMHPMIGAETDRRLEAFRAEGRAAAVLDVPLLFETGMEHMAEAVICMTAPRETQIARLLGRGMTREEALARIAAQMPVEEKAARSDFAVNTDRPAEETAAELTAVFRRLTGGEPLA